MNSHHYICILAGGIGSRFWPSSTVERPKQFLDILGVGKSLIQLTYDRCLQLVPPERILIITNKRYRALVQEHLPGIPPNNILCEPSMNNTGPAVAYAALRIQAEDPKAVFAMLPSDHMILKEDAYLDKLRQALDFAGSSNAIVTLGILPTRPDTGYGYISAEIGAVSAELNGSSILKVAAFKEKPDRETAEAYLSAGHYFWNAGMFIWSVETVLRSFEMHAPEILHELQKDLSKYNTEEEQAYIDRVYPLTPSISVDYAILERADNVFTIPSDIGWSDLGTWNSLHAFQSCDDNGNVVQIGQGSVIEVENSLIRVAPDKKVIIRGIKNFIVVDEKDALLIYPKDSEQEIKQILKNLE